MFFLTLIIVNFSNLGHYLRSIINKITLVTIKQSRVVAKTPK